MAGSSGCRRSSTAYCPAAIAPAAAPGTHLPHHQHPVRAFEPCLWPGGGRSSAVPAPGPAGAPERTQAAASRCAALPIAALVPASAQVAAALCLEGLDGFLTMPDRLLLYCGLQPECKQACMMHACWAAPPPQRGRPAPGIHSANQRPPHCSDCYSSSRASQTAALASINAPLQNPNACETPETRLHARQLRPAVPHQPAVLTVVSPAGRGRRSAGFEPCPGEGLLVSHLLRSLPAPKPFRSRGLAARSIDWGR